MTINHVYHQRIENAELFDTFHFETIPALPSHIELFSLPAHGSDKPETDSNLIMPNQLPWPERFEVESLCCKCDEQILDCYDFAFMISNRRILSGALSSLFRNPDVPSVAVRARIGPGENFRVRLMLMLEYSFIPSNRAPLKFSLFGAHLKTEPFNHEAY